MMSDSVDKHRVSIQAFYEQVENWQLTLGREHKKLKSLRTKIRSKILINQLDIITTQIEGQLINYRKLKNRQYGKAASLDIIQVYNQYSKRFMDIMEGVGCFADKVENESDELEIGTLNDIDGFADHENNIQSKRNYQDQTFTYTISKQQKFGKNQLTPFRNSSKVSSKKNSVRNTQANNYQNKSIPNPQNSLKSALKIHNSVKNKYKNIPKSTKNLKNTSLFRPSVQGHQQSSDELDSWEVRYQLKEIKSMMNQIQNEIRYHNHEDIQIQLSKIQHNNKKMSLQVKSLREDSQFIMNRIQKLKQQLAAEKQVQAQMIQQFQNPQRSRKKTKSQSVSNSHNRNPNNSTNDNQPNQGRHRDKNQQVSEWVRVRI